MEPQPRPSPISAPEGEESIEAGIGLIVTGLVGLITGFIMIKKIRARRRAQATPLRTVQEVEPTT